MLEMMMNVKLNTFKLLKEGRDRLYRFSKSIGKIIIYLLSIVVMPVCTKHELKCRSCSLEEF